MAKIIFVLICTAAFFAPFILSKESSPYIETTHFRGFPTHFEGAELRDLGLTDREKGFFEDFPGKIGRFTDGRREIIIRWVTHPTRKLHPAEGCFRVLGYDTKPLPLKIDGIGKRWSCFSATKRDESLRVCDRIHDDAGGEWTDVSSWYWSAMSQTSGEWWAITIAERK